VGRTQEAQRKNERREKILLTTSHPYVLGILYTYLRRSAYVKAYLITARIVIAKRNAIINSFYG
jgi:hypothetical protein